MLAYASCAIVADLTRSCGVWRACVIHPIVGTMVPLRVQFVKTTWREYSGIQPITSPFMTMPAAITGDTAWNLNSRHANGLPLLKICGQKTGIIGTI